MQTTFTDAVFALHARIVQVAALYGLPHAIAHSRIEFAMLL